MGLQGKGLGDALNDYIDKIATEQTTNLFNYDKKPKIPNIFDDPKTWKLYKSHMDVIEWKKFDDTVNMLIRLSDERRKELQSVGLI